MHKIFTGKQDTEINKENLSVESGKRGMQDLDEVWQFESSLLKFFPAYQMHSIDKIQLKSYTAFSILNAVMTAWYMEYVWWKKPENISHYDVHK